MTKAYGVGALALVIATSTVGAQVKTITGETETVTATVEAIERSSREVTLKGEDGSYEVLTAPPEMRRFDELKVGDRLKFQYYETMALKGLAKSSTDAADLFVAYQLALGEEKQMNAYTTGGYGWGWRGYGMGTTTVTTNTIVVGQLGLDIYDAGAKQLVWRGKASKTVDTKAKPEKRVKNLDKAMAKLLKNYPPPVKK